MPDPSEFSESNNRSAKTIFRPALIALVGIVVAFLTYKVVTVWEKNRIQLEFDTRASGLGHTVEQWILRQSDELYSVRALFKASVAVDADEFGAFAHDVFQRRPGLIDLLWIPRISAADRRAYDDQAVRSAGKQWPIREIGPAVDTSSAAARAVYYPIQFAEPFSVRPHLSGLDLAADPDRAALLESAARNDDMLVNVPAVYSAAWPGRTTVQIIIPVYVNGAAQTTPEERLRSLNGFIAAEYAWSEMIRPVLAGLDTADFQFVLSDITRTPRVLFAAGQGAARSDWSSDSDLGFDRLHRRTIFTLGNHRIAVDIAPADSYILQERDWPPMAALLAVIVLALAVAWYTYLNNRKLVRIGKLVTITKQAESQLLQLNRELDESRLFAEHVMDSNPSIIYIFDYAASALIYFNGGFTTILGYSTDEILGFGSNIVQDLFHPEDLAVYRNEIVPRYQTAQDDETIGRQMRLKSKSGEWLWFNCVERVFKRDPDGSVRHIAGSLQDITNRKAVENELAESREMLQLVLDTIPVRVFWKDLNSVFLGCNKGIAIDAGLASPAELIGKSDWDMSWKVEAEAFRADDLAVMTSGIPKIGYEERQTRPDGSTVWLRTNKIPLVNAAGNIIGVMGSYEDITERVRMLEALTESEARYRTVVERAWDGIFRADPAGRYIDVNDSGCRMLGYHRDDIIGLKVTDLIDRSDQNWNASAIGRLTEGQVVVTEQRLVCKDGSALPVEICRQMLPGGELIELVRDISVRKQAEQAIRELNAALELRVKERTVELQAANKELEAFAYSVSHDLRAPLRGIDGFSQALLEDYYDQLDETARDYLNRIRRASQRMAQLIDDMLGLSRLTRGDMQREPIDLSRIALRIAEEINRTHPEREVNWNIAEDVKGTGDPRLLEAAMENLLRNAWKFTGMTDGARVEFGSMPVNGITAYFVRDNGVGFDMAYANKLFGVFQRLHSAAEFEGNGIGLATVQRIIHRHGGRVWAEGEVGKGATFYFTLKP